MGFRWSIAIMLIICCLLVVALTVPREPPKQEVRLNDGSVVRFEQAGTGTIAYDSYSRVKAFVTDLIPARFGRGDSERIKGSFTPQTGTIGILYSVWTSEGKRKTSVANFISRIELVESTGFVFQTQISGYSSSANMVLIHVNSFPRRDRTFQMRCYEEGTDRLLFDLNIRNPLYPQEITEWSPEPVPATQTVVPLTVTLKHNLSDFKQKYVTDEDLVIESTDPRWTEPRPQRTFWLTDATGNRSYTLDGLSPFEPAWKLHLQFHRNPAAEFGENEVWRTGLMKIPAALTAERLGLKKTLDGLELEAAILSAAGTMSDEADSLAVTPSTHRVGEGVSQESGSMNGRPYRRIHSGLPFIQVMHPRLDADTNLIFTVKDQTGARISLESGVWHGTSSGYMRVLQFKPTAESTEIQLEAIVNRGRSFEFLVAPWKSANSEGSGPIGVPTKSESH
jgi:hypothetical protein